MINVFFLQMASIYRSEIQQRLKSETSFTIHLKTLNEIISRFCIYTHGDNVNLWSTASLKILLSRGRSQCRSIIKYSLVLIMLPFCSCSCVWAWVGCAGCWDGGGGAGSGCWGCGGLARVGATTNTKPHWWRKRYTSLSSSVLKVKLLFASV